MNIKELIRELKFKIRTDKKVLRMNIASMMSFFTSGNPDHITRYQHIIQNYADEIFKLDTNIEEYKSQLLELKHQLYQKAISNIYAKQELIKHKIVKHKKYYEIYNNVILEALPYKAVNIDSTQKFIVVL